MNYTLFEYISGNYTDYNNRLYKNNEENKTIVVLGGSFNPPTKAHLALLEAAVEATDADCGLFAPAQQWYVQRKMKKAGFADEFFGDKSRNLMLDLMCGTDSRLGVFVQNSEGNPKGYNYEILEEIKRNNPDSEIYFIVGADKLKILPRWHRIKEFLRDFKFLVAGRNGDNPQDEIDANTLLREYKDSFRIFSVSDDMADVSSSLFREMIRDNNYIAALGVLTPEVGEWFMKNVNYVENSISLFRDENYFLSNFYPTSIEYNGLTYENAEAAFQSQKTLDEEERSLFCTMDAADSKRAGRKVKLRSDWEEVKTQLMEEIVRAKFAQNPDLGAMLLNTGDKVLIEGNTWNDTCWGVSMKNGKGENRLGKILMKVRDELKQNIAQ